MAISTFAELSTAVQNWLDDTSLSARVPEFITLAEARINRDFGAIRKSWFDDSSLSIGSGDSTITLPTGFVEPRALFLTTFNENTMLTPFVAGTRELRVQNGIPEAWCINGDDIELDCPCDQTHTFLFRYRKKWDIATDLTNWLLTNYPDIYLAASLIEAYDFRDNYEAVTRWELKYRQGKEDLEQHEARNMAVATLSTDYALMQRGRVFNYSIGE